MKRYTILSQQYLRLLVLISLSLMGYFLSFPAYSNPTSHLESRVEINAVANNKIPEEILTQKKTTHKKILIEDSRGLSAFFILGIAINIIMAITFAWWFTGEWRKSKK